MADRVTCRTALLMTTLLAATAAAQEPPAAGPAEPYENRVAGIAFLPPAGGVHVHQADSYYLVRFAYPARRWDLCVRMSSLSKEVPLSAPAQGNDPGGMLQMTAGQSKITNPSIVVESSKVSTTLWSRPVGLIVSHSNLGNDRVFMQTALIPGLDKQTFYAVQFTSPAADKTAPPTGPGVEVEATDAFNRMMATVRLLDRASLKRDQNERLFHTRQWLTTLSGKKILSALEPDQYLRIIRLGKDVGFIHLLEVPAQRDGQDGVLLTARSHLSVEPQATPSPTTTEAPGATATPAALGEIVPARATKIPAGADAHADASPTTIDRLSKMFISLDRRHEDWSVVTNTGSKSDGVVSTSELGNSDKQVHRSVDRAAQKNGAPPADAKDPKEPHVRIEDRYHLSVSYYARARSGQPVERDLPPFYLPAALSQLLPRLLPIDGPQSFMFASYVSDRREIMSRYVDVQPEQNVVLEGQRLVAIPIRDRIGIDGAPTVHFMTHDGRWLGSENDDQKLILLPSDRAELEPIWKNALPPETPAAAVPAGR